MKKYLALLLALVMVFGMVACGTSETPAPAEPETETEAPAPETEETEEPAPETEEAPAEDDPFHVTDEPITFNFAAASPSGWGELKDKQFIHDLEAKTNVHIEWNQFPMEVANERVGILMASAPRPDAFWAHNNFSRQQADVYGMQGLLLDLKPLIMEHAPHIKNAIDTIDGWKALDAGDGCIYSIPAIDKGRPEFGTVYTELLLNTDMLAETGLEMPETTEEFYEVLKAIKGMKTEDGKDVIPFSYGPVYGYGDMLRGAFGIVDSTCGPSMVDGVYLMYDGETLETIADKDNYKEYIKYMNRLFTEGLMDAEVYTHDNNMFNAKGQSGQLASFVDWGGWVVVGQDKIEDLTYDAVPVLAGPDGTRLTQNRYGGVRNASDFCMTVDCKDPVTLIKYIDLFYDEDLLVGFENMNGPEGYNWDFNEEGIIERFPIPEEFNSYGEFRFSETLGAGPYFTYEIYDKDPINGNGLLKAEQDAHGHYNEYATTPILPVLSFTDEESEELTILRTDLLDYVKSFEAACVTGQKDVEAEWEGHLKQLENLGLQRLAEIYNDALTRYNNK